MEILDMPEDTFGEITKYPNYVDTLSLKYTCKICNILIPTKDFNLIVQEKLERYLGDAAYVFLQNLWNTNHYISGSFILKCLYGEDSKIWDGDIDIYTFSDSPKIVSDYLDFKTKGEFINKLYDLSFMTEPYEMVKQTIIAYGYNFTGTVHRRFEWKGLGIDLIMVVNKERTAYCKNCSLDLARKESYSNIFDFVETTFDIDVCKILYDGKKLYIKNKGDLLDRRTNAYSRLLEHTIVDILPRSTNEMCLLDKMLSRVEKYEGRGFIVEKKYDVNQILKDINALFERRSLCCLRNYSKYWKSIPERFEYLNSNPNLPYLKYYSEHDYDSDF